VRFSELDGATVGVWGAGREIRSFARELTNRLPAATIDVVALDAEPDEATRVLARQLGARIVQAADALASLHRCDIVVRSPGVKANRPELAALRSAGRVVTTATALWLAERAGRNVIGVSGTKGKSTTAALAAHVARASGAVVHLAGNIGIPAIDLLDVPADELAVIELSSYQITDLATGPEVAVMTNLYKEHTDWHGSEEEYRRDKLRLFELPDVRIAVVDPRNETIASAVRRSVAAIAEFGGDESWHVVPGGIAFGTEVRLATDRLPLPGEHNALNLCAALAALAAANVAVASLLDAVHGFHALPHRLQPVDESGGVLWVDDSISTTPESTQAALDSYRERPVVLLAGGQDRGQDYAPLAAALAARDVAVVGLPTTGARLVAAARTAGLAAERALEATDMESAVALARALAVPGAVVLLSPAAPSYDHYRDFEDRGDQFGRQVARGR
jgi:UDP-N-acetylmuramoylalanine--D-glutamate ligase